MEQLLRYPFDSSLILRKKKALKNFFLERQTDFLEKKIAILGGSTTAEITQILEIFLLANGIKPRFYESEYNMFYEDAVFGNDSLERFSPDIIYLHTTTTNIKNFPELTSSDEEIEQLLHDEIGKFQQMWKSLERFNCLIIQNNFELPVHRSLGNLDFYDQRGKTHFINRLNLELAKNARNQSRLSINDIHYLSAQIGLNKWHDPNLWFSAKYALSLEAIPSLANNLTKIIRAIYGKSKKGLVLDLDCTLWGGIIGDDGINGIQLGHETALGEAYLAFQKYIKELKQRGVILSVCSKNEYENALLGLSHENGILKADDFNVIKANWEPKNSNLVTIAQEINIGLDTLVFVDDNPTEREIIRNTLPTVAVPDVGKDITQYLHYLEEEGYFEVVSISDDDLLRNQYYEADKKRNHNLILFQSYDDFLASLEMSAKIKHFEKDYLERITQLVNKTNQFNLTTQRYSLAEVEELSAQPGTITLYGTLDDKFGSNGIVSLMVGKIKNSQCHLDIFLMSCRVLKRGMEQAMLDRLVQDCKARGLKEIIGVYIPSKKNKMVEFLYKELGFTLLSTKESQSTWVLNIDNYNNQNKFIKVN